MHDLFKENLTSREDQEHSEHKFPASRRSGHSRLIVPLIVTMVLWLGMAPVHSTEEPSQTATNDKAFFEITPSVVEEKIDAMKGRIKISEAAENDLTAQQFGVSLSDLQARTAKLRDIDAIYQRFLTALKMEVALEKEEAVLRSKIKTEQRIGLSERPPYSLSYYDHLLDQLVAAEQEKETAELAKKLAERGLEDATERLEEVQRTQRALKEQLESNKIGKGLAKLKWDFEQAESELELARAALDFQKVKDKNLKRESSLAELRLDISRQNIDWVRSHLHFNQADLQRQRQGVQRQRVELQGRLKKLIREQGGVEALWLRAEKKISKATKESEVLLASAYLKAREAWRETYQRALEQTEDMLQLLSEREQVWNRRYDIIKGDVDHEELDVWRQQSQARIKNIDRLLALQQRYQTNSQSQITALEKQISEESLNPEIREHLLEQRQALRKLSERSLEYLSRLLDTKELNQRLLDEIAQMRGHIALSKGILTAGDKVKGVWNFELWVIDEHSVTVKKVVIALFILAVGILIVKYVVRVIGKRLLPRARLEASVAAALQKMLYYLGLLLVVLFALRMVNIPLTAFTFLGGAIAIGVGFGAQNLINNFISGFILMAERPIKIGDLIEIEGNFAIVEEIGARCTRIRTAGNIHILVPNSSFLEKNITNWTLSDKMIRARITVGVAYGSPVREVERLMIEAVLGHEDVLKVPEPFVLFNDFGDNSLVFDVFFWIMVSRIMDRRIIESNIRFRIDDLFRKAGIVIAFPQRDVHLDTTTPLQFKILDANGGTEKNV